MGRRVSYEGGGGARIPPLPNLEIEYGYFCGAINISYFILHVIGHRYVSSKRCSESLSQIASEAVNLRGSKLKFLLGGGGGVGTHAYVCMSACFRTLLSSCYHPVFSPQLKILYENTLVGSRNRNPWSCDDWKGYSPEDQLYTLCVCR